MSDERLCGREFFDERVAEEFDVRQFSEMLIMFYELREEDRLALWYEYADTLQTSLIEMRAATAALEKLIFLFEPTN